MNRGFSLIEVVIAVAISSIIGVLLFNVFSQSTRALRIVDSIVSTDMKIVGFYDRFEKDVSGAFIPIVGDPEESSKVLMRQEGQIRSRDLERQEVEGDDKKRQASPDQTPSDQTPPDQEGPGKTSSPKMVTLADIQLKKPFVYESDGGNLKRFSFITCNPLQEYKQVKSRVARVTYQLKLEKGSKNYLLMRKESQKLSLKADKKAREYLLLNNIQSFSLTFLATEPPKKEEKKKALGQKDKKAPAKDQAKSGQAKPEKDEKEFEDKPLPLKKYESWPVGKEDKKNNQVRDLPQFVKISLVYKDRYEEIAKKYEFIVPIFGYRAPSEAVLRSPLLSQQRIKKDEIDGTSKAKR